MTHREEKEMTKYYLELNLDGTMVLYRTGDDEVVYEGRQEDAGITEDPDPDYTNKLDDFFQQELGIDPDEWEVG
jgi:hypothetical protein